MYLRAWISPSAFFFCALTVATPVSAARIDLGTLGGQLSVATAINNSGQVVGYSTTAGESGWRAFLYTGGAMIDLGTLGGTVSEAFDINDAGQVVGRAYTSGGHGHAFLYSGGVMTDLGTLGETWDWSGAFAINEAGQIAGYSETADLYPTSHAFLYSGGVMTDLGTLGGTAASAYHINEAGQALGSSYSAGNNEVHTFLYSGGVMIDVGTFGGAFTEPGAINEAGQVVGSATTAAEKEPHAFLYSGGVMTDLGTLGGTDSGAWDINDAGQVVGFSYPTGKAESHAFLYSNGVMTDLGTPLRGARTIATRINEAGEVVGVYTKGNRAGCFIYRDGVMGGFSPACEDPLINDNGAVATTEEVGGGARHAFLSFDSPFSCAPTPSLACVSASESSLQITDSDDDTKDQIRWRWSEGPEVTQAALGTPDSTTTYALCMYDSIGGVDVLVGNLQIGFLNAYWRNEAPKGYNYREKTGFEDGVVKVQLKAGGAGKARVQLQAKGTNIPMPTPISDTEFFDQDTRVTVQLLNSATPTCWTSEFTSATVNDGTQFKSTTP